MKLNKKVIGLCKSRHDIPNMQSYIFNNEINPLDLQAMEKIFKEKIGNIERLDLYVTGLTVALVEVINYCNKNNINLTLYHFNRDTGGYYSQQVINSYNLGYDAGYSDGEYSQYWNTNLNS